MRSASAAVEARGSSAGLAAVRVRRALGRTGGRFAGISRSPYVISLNLKRRHLNESQRSMVAARLANMKVGGREANAQICAIGAVSQDTAANLLHVSRKSVEHAKTVQKSNNAALIAAVEQGKIAVSAAGALARGRRSHKGTSIGAPTRELRVRTAADVAGIVARRQISDIRHHRSMTWLGVSR